VRDCWRGEREGQDKKQERRGGKVKGREERREFQAL